MKSLFDVPVRDGILNRLCALQPEAERKWGKMDAAQMLAHCSATLSMAAGQLNMPRVPLGRIIGPLFKPMFVGEKEFRRNGPTARELVIADQRQFDCEKERLLQAIHSFGEGGTARCTRHPHPFFGKLTPEQWGIVMYKHIDHHLRQFGA